MRQAARSSLSVRWKSLETTGLEHFSLSMHPDRVLGTGVIIGERGGTPYGLYYRVVADLQWRTREVRVDLVDGMAIHVFADGQGRWTDADGNALSDLDGCIDVDIAATPFTNTLPLRRLGLKIGESAELTMAYVPMPTLRMAPDGQRYTRIADNRYLYESADRSFCAELDVDTDGLVLDYPTLFKRIN